MKLKEIGEFELIERMARIFGREPLAFRSAGDRSRLAVGIGDDAAIWAGPPSGFTIATVDAMVEGVHFTARTTNWYDLGWKAMASNISDIAGTGGAPLYALAVLAAPGEQELEAIEEMCKGMADMAHRFGATVVGGDTVSSPTLMVSITLVGEALPAGSNGGPRVLSRYDAWPGDVLAVTGVLGSSAGGLELMLRSGRPIPESMRPLVEAHRRPLPRVREGQLLVEAGIRCGMDLSDGLAGDLRRICAASVIAANVDVDRLPIDPLLRQHFGEKAVDFALSGGEDYELLCAGPRELVDQARNLLDALGTPLTIIGSVSEADKRRPPLLLVDRTGKVYPPPRSGWEHFSTERDAEGT